MNMRLPSKKFFVGMISILAAIAILLTVVPTAYAESSPDSAIPGLGRINNDTLIRMHKQEGGWYNDQDALLKEASQLSVNFQKVIDAEAKAKKNVSILQNALDTFDNELSASKEIHGQAGNIIYSLVGWRSTGDVKDRLAAGQSLLDGRAALQDANFRLTRAMPALEKGFNAWRASRIDPNRPTAIPAPTADCISSDILPCPVY